MPAGQTIRKLGAVVSVTPGAPGGPITAGMANVQSATPATATSLDTIALITSNAVALVAAVSQRAEASTSTRAKALD